MGNRHHSRGGGDRKSSRSDNRTAQYASTLAQTDAEGYVCTISISNPTNAVESVQASQPFYKEFKDL